MNESEFYKGYKKALSDLKEELKEETYSNKSLEKILDGLGKQKKASLKPIIYFTKLDKKGNLEYDREKTDYYAAHPEELENLKFEDNKAVEDTKQSKIPELVRVPEGSADYAKVIDNLGVSKKTIELCKAENAIIYSNFQELDTSTLGAKDPRYLNALGQQLIFLSQRPATFEALGNVMNIDPSTDAGITKILNELARSKELLQFKETLQEK